MKSITTKYHGPSATKGSRISATDNDGNRVMISKDLSMSDDGGHADAARALCRKMNWHGEMVTGWLKPGQHVFVFTQHATIITV